MPSSITLAPDNDGAGVDSLQSNYYALEPYFREIYFVFPPDGVKDWNDVEKSLPGSARPYVEQNREILTLPKLFDL